MGFIYAIGFLGFALITIAGLLSVFFAWVQMASDSPIVKVLWVGFIVLTIGAGSVFYFTNVQRAEQAVAMLEADMAEEIRKEGRKEASQSIFYALGLVGFSLASAAVARSLRKRPLHE